MRRQLEGRGTLVSLLRVGSLRLTPCRAHVLCLAKPLTHPMEIAWRGNSADFLPSETNCFLTLHKTRSALTYICLFDNIKLCCKVCLNLLLIILRPSWNLSDQPILRYQSFINTTRTYFVSEIKLQNFMIRLNTTSATKNWNFI